MLPGCGLTWCRYYKNAGPNWVYCDQFSQIRPPTYPFIKCAPRLLIDDALWRADLESVGYSMHRNDISWHDMAWKGMLLYIIRFISQLDICYISGRFMLHAWTTIIYLDGNTFARHTSSTSDHTTNLILCAKELNPATSAEGRRSISIGFLFCHKSIHCSEITTLSCTCYHRFECFVTCQVL